MTVIDLSTLDPPDLVETLDFEAAYHFKLQHFKSIYPDSVSYTHLTLPTK